MPTLLTNAWRRSALVVLAGVLSACAGHQRLQPALHELDTGPLGVRPPTALDAPFEAAAWWEAWGDARLSALIDQALADSPTVQVAQARLLRAQAQERFARGSDLPQVQAAAELGRQRFTEQGLYPRPVAGSTLNTGTLQLEGLWELDLFGRQRAEVEASLGQRRAAQADVQAARLLLSSQVARQYVQLARLQAQQRVAERALAQRDEMLALVRQRVDAGLDSGVELRQSQGALPDARQQIALLDEQVMLSRHALAVLTAQAPNALHDLQVSIEAITPPPQPQSVPLDLLARRADVQAARWRAESMARQSDAARAAFYPNINLTSYVGFNAIGLSRVLEGGSLQWGLLPALHLPLFDGDRRMANLGGRVAEQDAATATYNQAVLQAVQEVVDQLGSVQAIARQQAEQQAAQQHIEAAYALATSRYRAGLGNHLTLLSAETAVLSQRRQAVDLRARALDARFALVRALGGEPPVDNTSSVSPSPASAAPAAPVTPQLFGDRS